MDFGWIIGVIVIIGVLGKLLGSTRQKTASQEMKRPRIFGIEVDQPTDRDDLDSRESFDSINTVEDENYSKTNDIQSNVNRPYGRETDHPYARETGHPYERESLVPYKRETPIPYRKQQKRRSSPFRHLTKEQLREGIVLAEVLSEKPRAKNPHPSAIRYRRTKN